MRVELTSRRGTAEVHTDSRPHALQPVDIRPVQNPVPHRLEQLEEVGPPEVGPALQLGQGVDVRANRVEHDVLRRVHVELLRQVGVDLEELHARGAGDTRGFVALCLKRRQEGLEPLERARVLADPDELHTAETRGRVGPVAEMPNVLEDGGPRRHTDASADQNCNLVLEHVLGRSAVGPVDEETGHLLAVLKCHFIHAQGIDAIVELSLRGARADGVSERSREITHLADVNGDVGVIGAGGDSEWVPLELGDARNLEEKPLAGLVPKRRLVELDLNDVFFLLVLIYNPEKKGGAERNLP